MNNENLFNSTVNFYNINNENFIEFLSKFYGDILDIKSNDESHKKLINELFLLYDEFNEKGIDEKILKDKIDLFLESNQIIKKLDKLKNDTEDIKTETNNISSQLNTKTNLNNEGINVSNNGENTNGNAIGKFYIGQDGDVRVLELYNRSGIKEGGTHTNNDGKETFVIHHYNDKGSVQIDNVGRNNFILKLKNARNKVQAKHDNTGSGDFIVCERDCSDLKATASITHDSSINRTVNLVTNDVVYDKFSHSIYKSLTTRENVDLWAESFNDSTKWSYIDGLGNEILMSIEGVNLKEMGLSSKDEFVPSILGRLGGKFKDFLFKSVYFFTKGNNDQYGQPAMVVYSTTKGGECIKTKNVGTSKGASIYIENYSSQPLSSGVRVDGKSTNAMYTGYNYNNSPYQVFQSLNENNPDIIQVKDKNNNILFKVSGDGKTIFMRDSGDGSLKALRITNGVLDIT